MLSEGQLSLQTTIGVYDQSRASNILGIQSACMSRATFLGQSRPIEEFSGGLRMDWPCVMYHKAYLEGFPDQWPRRVTRKAACVLAHVSVAPLGKRACERVPVGATRFGADSAAALQCQNTESVFDNCQHEGRGVLEPFLPL